jgi:hypothetical protein
MKEIGLAVLLVTAAGAAAQVEITSFHGNGVLTWTNSEVPAICHVEWAPNLTTGWFRSWAELTDILMPDHRGLTQGACRAQDTSPGRRRWNHDFLRRHRKSLERADKVLRRHPTHPAVSRELCPP